MAKELNKLKKYIMLWHDLQYIDVRKMIKVRKVYYEHTSNTVKDDFFY